MSIFNVVRLLWYLFPILVIFACNYLVQRLSLYEKIGLKSPDLATFFLFIGLHFLSKELFEISVLPYVLILVLFIGMGVAIGHARYFGDIQYRRFFKMFWRITFLVLIVVYIGLAIYGIFT